MTLRTALLLLLVRLLGGRWFPVRGYAVLLLRGPLSEERREHYQRLVAPLGVRVVALPPYIEVHGVIAEWPA